MVQAWYMNSTDEDQRLPHHKSPPAYLSLDELYQKSGVLYWKLDPLNFEAEGKLKEIREERGYSYHDILECSPTTLENYCEKIKMFYKEHLHADEEVRFCVAGSGYFDVRDVNDEWIRVLVTPGDLILLPAGIYHRFTLDENNYIKAMRLFIGEPVWTAINRPADDHPARATYLEQAKELAVQ